MALDSATPVNTPPASQDAPQVRYTLVARLLHWLIALLIIAGVIVFLNFDDMKLSPAKIKLINYHKWIGITVLWLLVVRAAWRTTHRPPALPDSMPVLHQRAAALGHAALYLLMLTVPVLGWLASSAKGFPIHYLGVVALPDLVEKDKDLAETLNNLHGYAAWTLVVVASLHALVALKHRFIDRDDILQRML